MIFESVIDSEALQDEFSFEREVSPKLLFKINIKITTITIAQITLKAAKTKPFLSLCLDLIIGCFSVSVCIQYRQNSASSKSSAEQYGHFFISVTPVFQIRIRKASYLVLPQIASCKYHIL